MQIDQSYLEQKTSTSLKSRAKEIFVAILSFAYLSYYFILITNSRDTAQLSKFVCVKSLGNHIEQVTKSLGLVLSSNILY